MDDLLKKTTLFADNLDHPECVAVHIDGSVWAGGEAGQVYRISADGKDWEEVINTGGFVLGIAFSPGCEWLAICDSKNKCVWKFQLDSKELVKYSNNLRDYQLNIPNYPVFDSSGNLYVSDSGSFNETKGKIIKFSKDGHGFVWHSGPFSFSNGLALEADETKLYVVCSWLPGVEMIGINSDGSAGERIVYCTMPRTIPDGIAFDVHGNLYVSCYIPNAIYKISKERTSVLLVEDWQAHTLSNPTNIAFGGEKMDQLFTANLGRWHINKIDLGIPGQPLASHTNNKK